MYCNFLGANGCGAAATRVSQYLRDSAVGTIHDLPGPVGERNVYAVKPRGRIAAVAQTASGLLIQIGAILATGNTAVIPAVNPAAKLLADLSDAIQSLIFTVPDWREERHLSGVLFEGDADALLLANQAAAMPEGPIVLVQGASVSGLMSGEEDYSLNLLLQEISISTNTAAAGGNASLMTIG
jgi:RHH-type proline utilization regulon transcriptional repressor/proline dehydrogenase/delta 1-pyrroline-5-carboxylate dehydrogenase